MKKLLTLLLFVCTAAIAGAQDKIFMTSGKIIECKVVEVGTEEIKYKISPEADAALFAVKKIDVLKIEFANGTVETFADELEDPDLYANNNKNAWKFNFLSPLYGNTQFGYEHSFKPGFSLDGTFGIIGLGLDPEGIRPRGAFINVGPRFMRTPDFRKGSLRYYHVMKGAYIQPLVTLGVFGSDRNYTAFNNQTNQSYTINARETTTYGSLMLVFGKQMVYSNVFLIDYYAGFGWGFNNTSNRNEPEQIQGVQYFSQNYVVRRTYGSVIGSNDIPLAGTLGIKIGFLTK